jgi:hypothetical protein
MNHYSLILFAFIFGGSLAPGVSLGSTAREALSFETDAMLAFHGGPLTLKSSVFDAQTIWLPELSEEPSETTTADADKSRIVDGSSDESGTVPGVSLRPRQNRLGLMSSDELSGNGLFASFLRSDWTTRLLSSYQVGEDLWFKGAGTIERGHGLSGSYRLRNSMIVAPSLSYREISQGWSSARTDIPTASEPR